MVKNKDKSTIELNNNIQTTPNQQLFWALTIQRQPTKFPRTGSDFKPN